MKRECTITDSGIEFVATCKVVGNRYYRWTIKQKGWIKGMPVWRSRLFERSDDALNYAIRLFRDTTHRIQVGL